MKLLLLLTFSLFLASFVSASGPHICLNTVDRFYDDEFDLQDYPDIIGDDVKIIFSDLAHPDDMHNELAAELGNQLGLYGPAFIEARDVEDIKKINAIILGNRCVNPATAELTGSPYDCTEGLVEGYGYIRLFYNEPYAQIVVEGYTVEDFLKAANHLIEGGEMQGKVTKIETTSGDVTWTGGDYDIGSCFCNQKGFCIPGPVCEDDDLGNIEIKGKITGLKDSSVSSYFELEDYCFNGKLYQYSCFENSYIKVETNCDVCEDGVCKTVQYSQGPSLSSSGGSSSGSPGIQTTSDVRRVQEAEPQRIPMPELDEITNQEVEERQVGYVPRQDPEDSSDVVRRQKGCFIDGVEFEKGNVVRNLYCDGDMFVTRLHAGDACEENYQCTTGICDGTCKQQNIFRMFGNWLSRIF